MSQCTEQNKAKNSNRHYYQVNEEEDVDVATMLKICMSDVARIFNNDGNFVDVNKLA